MKTLRAWWIIPLLLVAAGLGFRSLNTDTIWYDEYYSLYYAGAAPQFGPVGLDQILERVTQDNEQHPPGYYFILSLWGRLVGWSAFAGRALSAFFGLLTIAVVYRLGTDLGDRTMGFGAAAAIGGSALFIFYFHELRSYTLYPLMVSLSILLYWRLLRSRNSLSLWLIISFIISLTVMLFTHYMAVTVFGAMSLYHLIAVPKIRRWWLITFLASLPLFLFLPWIRIAALGALGEISGADSRGFFALKPDELIQTALYTFSNGSIGLFILFATYAFTHRNQKSLMIGWVASGTIIATLILNEKVQFITNPRYISAWWPVLALVVGLGVSAMAKQRLKPWLPLTLWVAAGIWLSLQPPEPDPDEWQVYQAWDQLAQNLQQYGQRGNSVLYYLPEPVPHWIHAPVAAYYLYELPATVNPMPPWAYPAPVDETNAFHVQLVESLEEKTPQAFYEEASTLIQSKPHVWIAYDPSSPPSPFVQTAIQELMNNQYQACSPQIELPKLSMIFYAQPTVAQSSNQFEQGIQIKTLAPIPQTARQYLSVVLGWSLTTETPPNTYSVGLHLEDDQHRLVAQADYGLPTTLTGCQITSIPLQDLPNGQYQLFIVVYNWQTGERLAAQQTDRQTDSPEQLDRLLIGEFTINN